MANVLLPLSTEEEALHLQKTLMEQHHLTMVYGSVPHRDGSVNNDDGKKMMIYFMRVSSQVYLEMKDFHHLAKLVLEILK
jgi:hypothetical protein